MFFRDGTSLKIILQTFFIFFLANLGFLVGNVAEVVVVVDGVVVMILGEVEPMGDSVVVEISILLKVAHLFNSFIFLNTFPIKIVGWPDHKV